MREIQNKIDIMLHIKCQFLSDLNETSICPYIFFKNTHISNFMKICQVGSEMLYVGGGGGGGAKKGT
jgi:hypothetical protein